MSSLPPLYDDSDGDQENDAFGIIGGRKPFGMAGRRPFQGLINFGLNPARKQFRGFGSAEDDAGWLMDYNRYLSSGMPDATARQLADAAHPYANGGTALGKQIAAAQAAQQAQDAKNQATAMDLAAKGAKASADVAVAQANASSGRALPSDLSTGRTGAAMTSGGAGGAASAPGSNTMMYVGAAAVALGLAFVAMKKGRGSLGGYRRRTRKSRKSRRSRR